MDVKSSTLKSYRTFTTSFEKKKKLLNVQNPLCRLENTSGFFVCIALTEMFEMTLYIRSVAKLKRICTYRAHRIHETRDQRYSTLLLIGNHSSNSCCDL